MPRYDADAATTRDAWPAILSATEPEVRTRIRIEHSRTIKEGWSYASTVEVIYDGSDDEDARDRLRQLLEMAALLGEAERDIRQARDEQRAVSP